MACSQIMLRIAILLLLLLTISSSSSNLPDQDSISSSMPSLLYPRKNVSFTARLIHRTSPESPFYDPNAKCDDLIGDGIRTSLARAHFLGKRTSILAESLINARSPVRVIGVDFVMSYSIGTPPVKTFGIADTASHVIWLQCQPCDRCYKQSIPFYNRDESSTYKSLPCGPRCDSFGDTTCYSSSPWGAICRYHSDYMEKSSSNGYLSTETIMLPDNGITGEAILEDMIFGCGTENTDRDTKPKPPGVIGLSNRTSSLIGQLAYPRFSYYIFTNSSGTHGWIHFGLSATTSGPGTSLVPNDFGHYRLSLVGLMVSGQDIDYDFSSYNQAPEYEGGFVIDTGTLYTVLDEPIFNALREKIAYEVYDEEPQSYNEIDHGTRFELCYKNAPDYPEVEFQFANQMELMLCKSNTWVKVSNGLHCLAILKASEGISVLGMYQQRHLQVGYDLSINQVTMKYQVPCPDNIE
ncbi:hypothetical protein RJ639_004545 [Escallonia herrerae]|uniref:Peptidase A1 domain-containing protein n=1 Tax=Escallonia herrerae TaxID=1293975 RepID=A0AA88W1A3_9ASTE|nr:hypothetical protein RJ639_004545 [Escallonia herrerae]